MGASGKGSGQLMAGGDVKIASVVNEDKTSQFNDAASKTYDRQVHAHQSVMGQMCVRAATFSSLQAAALAT